MTATLEHTQSNLPWLVTLVQRGEDVLITDEGCAVARLSAVKAAPQTPDRQAWLARLAGLREQLATGKPGATVEQMLDEDRGD